MIIDKIKNWNFFRTEEQAYLSDVSDTTSATFCLFFESLLIGTLTLKAGVWEFGYSSDFKSQDKLLPLVNFPKKERVYQSTELFPFFALRIPGEGQLKAKGLDIKSQEYSNPVNLLEMFGVKNIANPYVLEKT
jgi:HipA-like protein